jgi:hypothetical protein
MMRACTTFDGVGWLELGGPLQHAHGSSMMEPSTGAHATWSLDENPDTHGKQAQHLP